ncbi:MAG: acyltransferase [Desulfobacteraceae bacterium]|nr:acyltransferase [Desulfobacteraceae bacterium]
MPFMTERELLSVCFKYIGENVRISTKASIYNASGISVGDNARIDDFCILSAGNGGIIIGKYAHIGCYSSLIGQGAIILEDFSGISGRVSVYSSNDDYSGGALTHPTVPDKYRNVSHGSVVIRKHAIIGAGSVILPNVEIGIGAVVGALSLVKSDCDEFGVYAGIPAKKIAERKRDILRLEEAFLDESRDN